jgi:hypothetical protein
MENIVSSVLELNIVGIRVDWEGWLAPYAHTEYCRRMRRAPAPDDSMDDDMKAKTETLIVLIETFARVLATTGTASNGSVELQLALHGLIALRFRQHPVPVGERVLPLLREMSTYLCRSAMPPGDEDAVRRCALITDEIVERYDNMASPVFVSSGADGGDAELLYPNPKIFGVDSAFEW